MNENQLKELGVPEDLISGVIKAHKEAIDGNYVTKAAFEAERTKAKDLNVKVGELQSVVDAGTGNSKTIDELSRELAEAKKLAKLEAKKAETAYAEATKKFTIERALEPKVHDVSDVLGKIDMSTLTFEDGKVIGLDEQVEALKAVKPHWFKSEVANPANPVTPFVPGGFVPTNGAPGTKFEENVDPAMKFAKIADEMLATKPLGATLEHYLK